MKGAAQFFLDTLVAHPTLGYLVTNPSNSPELPHHANASVCAGPDHGQPDPARPVQRRAPGPARCSAWTPTFRTQVLAARDRLAPMRVGSRGNIQEWLADWVETERTHRHVSHLYGLHPSNQITKRGTPELYEAARRTLELRGDDGTGWSLAWKINFWARLEDGARAHKLIRDLVTTGPARAEHVRPAPAVPDRRQLRRHLGHRRDAAAEPQRRAAPAAGAAGRLAHRQVTGLRGRGGYTVGMDVERRPGRRIAHPRRPRRHRQAARPDVHRRATPWSTSPTALHRRSSGSKPTASGSRVSAGRTYRVQPTGQPSGSLEQYFSNAGTTNDDNTGVGDFDGGGATLSAQALAQVAVTPGATVSRDGVNFRWPNVQPGGFDNAMAAGQSIAVSGTGSKLGFLATGTYGAVAGTATVVYADGTRQSFTLSVPDWYGGPKPGATAAIVAPYQNRPGNRRENTAATIYYTSVALAAKPVVRVELPNISARPAPGVATMHIFAMAIGS